MIESFACSTSLFSEAKPWPNQSNNYDMAQCKQNFQCDADASHLQVKIDLRTSLLDFGQEDFH